MSSNRNASFSSGMPVLYWLYIPALLFLAVTLVISSFNGIPFWVLTSDPLTVTRSNAFLGMISNVGMMFWSFTVAICFFCYVFLRSRVADREFVRFIFYGGAISLVLLLDDLFMFHEKVFPGNFGIDQLYTLSFYASMLMLYLVYFRQEIFRTNYYFLGLALLFLSASLLFDILPDSLLSWNRSVHSLFEDGSKFIGIVGWFGYFFLVCLQLVKTVSVDRQTGT